MVVIVTRAGKGSPLTNAEVDANFTNLNAGLAPATAAASDVWAGTDATKATTSKALADAAAFQPLVDAATVAWNTATQGFDASVTVTANRIIGNPTNLKDGLTYTLEIVQGGAGGFTVTWGSTWDFGDDGPPVIAPAVGARTLISAIYRSASAKLHVQGDAGGAGVVVTAPDAGKVYTNDGVNPAWSNTVAGPLNVGGILTVNNILVLPTFSSQADGGVLNDYSPTNFAGASVAYINTNAAGTVLTGLVAGPNGRILFLKNNNATYGLTIMAMDARSAVANRFTGFGAGQPSLSLQPGKGAIFVYQGQWQLVCGEGTCNSYADIWAGTNWGALISPAVLAGSAGFQTITGDPNVTWNTATQGINAAVYLSSNRVIDNPTGMQDGLTYTLELGQDTAGGRTVTWGSKWNWGSVGPPTLSTGANKRDYVDAQYRGGLDYIRASFWGAA